MPSDNLSWHSGQVTREQRCDLLGTPNRVYWLTGLSGSGKSTIAQELEKALHEQGTLCYVLDGDNIRHGLNSDLGFSAEDRSENIRRVSEITKLFYDTGITIIVSFISPFQKDRQRARTLIGPDFIEVFVDCPVEECEKRDPKGLYKKARAGELAKFTGIDSPYERPDNPEITVDTTSLDVHASVSFILQYGG